MNFLRNSCVFSICNVISMPLRHISLSDYKFCTYFISERVPCRMHGLGFKIKRRQWNNSFSYEVIILHNICIHHLQREYLASLAGAGSERGGCQKNTRKYETNSATFVDPSLVTLKIPDSKPLLENKSYSEIMKMLWRIQDFPWGRWN